MVTNLKCIKILTNQPKEPQLFQDIQIKTSNLEEDIFKFIVGIQGFYSLDPQEAWDVHSYNLIDQVCEGLFKINLSDPDYGVIPHLAEDYGIWNENNYTISLKTGITFHDETLFNSTAVQFTFDRLSYFINNSMATSGSLYKYFDPDLGKTIPIINKTEIIDVDTIRFVLNRPYGLFETLLSIPASYILSPASTPSKEVINLTTGDLIGTGPFVYDHFVTDQEVKLHAFDDYWVGKANISLLQFSVIPNIQDRNDALLSGQIDLLLDPSTSMIPIFEADSEIKVINTGQSTNIKYLSMNNNNINITWRKAISYAINYSDVINQLTNGYAERLKSPIPESILFANCSHNVAIFNITKSREKIQSMGFGEGWDTTYPGSNEAEWSSASFATFNYTYNIENVARETLLSILQNNLNRVGIDVIDDGLSWMDYLQRIFNPTNYDLIDFADSGWIADYNDPSNYINNLLTNRTESLNLAQYNGFEAAIDGGRDPFDLWDNVQLLMEEALFETNQSLRKIYYNRIQEILVEEDMPWVYLYVADYIVAYRNHILGFQPNPYSYLSFYGVTLNSTIAPKNIYIDGNVEWQYFKNAGKCTGEGTISEPYIIKDLVIDGRNNSLSCIRIYNSNVYFRIENCTLFNSTAAGIELNNVSNSEIIENNCSNNKYGIYLNPSTNNEISNNFINNNSLYGILLENADNNLIFNNTIIWNYINAFDNGTSNDWDNGIIGNYWSDYDGIDSDNDGVGEIPYNIPGGSQDNFPLRDRYVIPGIDEYVPAEQIIKVGYLNDLSEVRGVDGWKGAYLAAKEINEAGGVLINGSLFYVGLRSTNSLEGTILNDELNITKAVNAANNLISNYDPQFLVGGSNYDALSSYLEPIMDAKIPFFNIGVPQKNLIENVLNNYSRYKYFFNVLINNSEAGRELISFELYLASYLNSILSRPINKIALLYNPKYPYQTNLIDALKIQLQNNDIDVVKEITVDGTNTKDDYMSYWDKIDNAGAQLTLVTLYSENTTLLSEAYGEVKPRCLMLSCNDYNFRDTYWNDTNGGSKYEIACPAIFNISRTSRSIPFWNNFINEYNHEPTFFAGSSYDAIYLILNATLDSQSFSASKTVESLEKIDTSNIYPGLGGKLAFTKSHSLFHITGQGSEGYASMMMGQWQADGSRKIIHNYFDLIYPDSLATGNLQTPDWGINIRFKINSPVKNSLFTEMAPAFNIEILDTVDKMWYTLNSGSEKYFFTNNETIDELTWENELSDGSVRITFFANDTDGHIFKRYVNIIKDTEPPDVSIEPMETTTFASEAPTIFLNIQDTTNITERYYSLDGGVTKIPFTGTEVTINQTLWDTFGEGIIRISFYIIDSVGKETIIYVDVNKDLPGAPGGDNFLFFIIIGVITLFLGVVSTIAYTQHRRKKKRRTEWAKLKKKKGLISPEQAKGKNLIFISYATKDSELFQIPLINDILIQYPEIDEILYWESDMHDDIYEYMDDNLKLCSVFLLFCTQNSFYSEPVKMEWRSALKLDKKIIPIFINPNDIPPLLTTKLGVQFKESEIYDSIEILYQMILKKLEIASRREFCNYLIPKSVSNEYFDEKIASMFKEDIEIESDIPINDLELKLISILEKNHFEILKKPTVTKEIDTSESHFLSLRFFAEDKFEKQEIGLTAMIQKPEYNLSRIYLRIMGAKKWMLKEILRDLDNKFYSLKTISELLRIYSENIENYIEQIDNLEEFLRENYREDFEKLEEILYQYLSKKIQKDEFLKKGLLILGKKFLLVFIENFPKKLKLSVDKKKEDDKHGKGDILYQNPI